MPFQHIPVVRAQHNQSKLSGLQVLLIRQVSYRKSPCRKLMVFGSLQRLTILQFGPAHLIGW
jgi:hypothetical protein